MSVFQPPYPPYDPTDIAGFSYETVVKRWPTILTNVIDHMHRAIHDLIIQHHNEPGPDSDAKDKRHEGKQIIEQLSKLKYEMGRDKSLQEIPADGEADAHTYNIELAALREKGLDTWFKAPWLFAECYLYRWMRSLFALTKHWHEYDPFSASKEDAFKGSSAAVFKLAATMQELNATKDEFKMKTEKIGVIFREMIQMSLWGNATDLSLLTNLTHEDIRKLQSVGKEAQEERRTFILRDDFEAAWNQLKTLDNARIDFILDNSGFEVYTDIVFADFLLTCTPYVSRVVFHPKSIPWFVSDVTPPDFMSTFESLLSPSFFPTSGLENADNRSGLEAMVHRWKSYLDSGAFALSVPLDAKIGERSDLVDFWTTPYPYWDMEAKAPVLMKNLKQSGLVIFKGDLNYRKLTGDVRWPASTPFEEAIGPLAGSFPLLSLRTAKADVVVGVDQAKADELDASGEKWRFNGKYALISFVPGSQIA